MAVRLKWPNDLLHGPSERKLAGILAQTTGTAVVLGIGLNVSTTEAELPVTTASSLVLCGASDPDRTALLAAILTRAGPSGGAVGRRRRRRRGLRRRSRLPRTRAPRSGAR